MYDFFYGWYLKCQSDMQTLAVIPAVHQAGRKRTCSIQMITNDGVWTETFPGNVFHRVAGKIFIGENQFGEQGIRLAVDTLQLKVRGRLHFGSLTPLKYDIMGPFVFIPFLECRHSVMSMRHPVWGKVCVNEQEYNFHNAWGYWEGDCGRSFPKEYAWTQCCFYGGSLMLSVAAIPMAGLHFTGVIGIVLWQEREYRFATYLGARVVKRRNGILRVVQGDMELEARLLETTGHPLKAPSKGNMKRTIHENPCCRTFYRFEKAGYTIFAFETKMASFEYEYL